MTSLDIALQDATSAVRANMSGHLSLAHRATLMHLVGDPTTVNRVFLECVKRVYPLWFEVHQFDSTVLELVKTAESYLSGDGTGAAPSTALADRFRNGLEDDAEVSAMAGMSATSLCYSIANNAAGILGIELSAAGVDDVDFDWEVWNPDFFASIAASGGNPFVNEGSPDKRREFWLWYLDTLGQIQAGALSGAGELPVVEREARSTQVLRSQTHNLPAIKDKISRVVELCIRDLQSEGISTWDQLLLSGECMKGGLAMKGRYVLNAEEHAFKLKYYLYKGDESSVALMNHVKYEMYEQYREEGAWMQFDLAVGSDLEVTATFNYDDRDALPENRKDTSGLEEEFKTFPRSRAFTPEWWQAIVDKRGLAYLKPEPS